MGIYNEHGIIMFGMISNKKEKEFIKLLKSLKRKNAKAVDFLYVWNGSIRILFGFTGSKVGWGNTEYAMDAFQRVMKYLEKLKWYYHFNIYEIEHGELTNDKVLFTHREISHDFNKKEWD